MSRAIRSLIAVFILFTSSTDAISQAIGIDSKGNDVFNFYKADEAQLTISSGDPTIKVNYNIPYYRSYWYVGDTSNKTVATSKTISIDARLSGSNDYLFLSNLGDLKPTFSLRVGVQRTIDKFINIDAIPRMASARGIEAVVRVDNEMFYDTINNTEKRKLPVSYGLSSQYSLFKLFGAKELNISFGASIESSWNTDDLSKYYRNRPTFSNTNVIALGDPVGRIGSPKRVVDYRFRVAVPILPYGRLNILPYASVFSNFNTSPNYIVGGMINLLGEGIPTNGRDYLIVQGFGIGFDFHKKGSEWSKPNIFVAGTFELGKFNADREVENR